MKLRSLFACSGVAGARVGLVGFGRARRAGCMVVSLPGLSVVRALLAHTERLVMDRSLPVLPKIQAASSCVWVDAGVLSYRLCDRGFACETCPLDAAIRNDGRVDRGGQGTIEGEGDGPLVWGFPNDRLYAAGHVWVQVVRAGRVRIGLDACAAGLLPRPKDVRCAVCETYLARGAGLMEARFEGGELTVAAPVAGRVCAANQRLMQEPGLLHAEPYGGGWIAEMRVDSDAEIEGLQHGEEARERARLETRRFVRQAALALLMQEHPERLWMAPGFPEATRRALSGEMYLSMLREMLGQGRG